jgi:hypothetical protein
MGTGMSLHIGLNTISPDHYDGWSGPLAGCENDARAMDELARGLGYDSHRLLTAEATRDAVTSAIDGAARRLGAGDTFLVTYAGHGGQVPDTSGDEDDGWDETWCLHDGQLLDDELVERWHRFAPGVRIIVVSDSCHSGTVSRAPVRDAIQPTVELGISIAGGFAGGAPRYLPADRALRTFRQHRQFYTDIQNAVSVVGELPVAVRLLSGCQDNQVSLDGAENGLFTTVLLAVWDEGRFTGDYDRFHREMLLLMPPTQSPNHLLLGPTDSGFDGERPFTH